MNKGYPSNRAEDPLRQNSPTQDVKSINHRAKVIAHLNVSLKNLVPYHYAIALFERLRHAVLEMMSYA